MPRDASLTRARLLDAGERLFADEGIHTVALTRIVDAAGQRNTSALHYHFGGRLGLVFAIIERHNAAIEADRRARLVGAPDDLAGVGLRELVEAFVEPFASALTGESGRRFLCIVAQLGDTFEHWDVANDRNPSEALRVLLAVDRLLGGEFGLPPDLRHDRITRFLESISAALGHRARAQLRGATPVLDDARFTANLVDMGVGALSASPSPAASASHIR